jgi:hypothetical protein
MAATDTMLDHIGVSVYRDELCRFQGKAGFLQLHRDGIMPFYGANPEAS